MSRTLPFVAALGLVACSAAPSSTNAAQPKEQLDTLEAQAAQPLLNPVEMNNADAAGVAAKLRQASYADQFRSVFGPQSLDDDHEALTATSSEKSRWTSAATVGRSPAPAGPASNVTGPPC